MKRIFLILVFFIGVSLSSFADGKYEGSTTMTEGCRLFIHVVFADNNATIFNATLHGLPPEGGSLEYESTGRIIITAESPGTYRLEIRCDGYYTYVLNLTILPDNGEGGGVVVGYKVVLYKLPTRSIKGIMTNGGEYLSIRESMSAIKED